MITSGYIAGYVLNGQECTISLALLERRLNVPPEVPALRVIESWVHDICSRLNCRATIHPPSDVVTFYPVSAK